MEKSHAKTRTPPEYPVEFHCHRRSHLKSETFRALVHILSHCYADSQCSLSTPIVREKLKLDNGSDELDKSTGRELQDELVGCDTVVHDNLSTQDTVVDKNMTGSDIQCGGTALVQMRMDELEHIMSVGEHKEPVHENNTTLSTLSPNNTQSSNEIVELLGNQEDYSTLEEYLLDEPGYAEQLPVDNGIYGLSNVIELSFKKDMSTGACDSGNNIKDKTPSLNTNAIEEVGHEMRHRDTDLENSVCTNSKVDPCFPIHGNKEIEEGEISGELGLSDQSDDMFFQDGVSSEEKKGVEEQISEDDTNKKVAICRKQKRPNELNSEPIFTNNANKNMQAEENKKYETMREYEMPHDQQFTESRLTGGHNCMPEVGRNKCQDDESKEEFDRRSSCLGNAALHGEILEEKADNNSDITITKKDASVSDTKKRNKRRGGCAEERKEKQRKRKRIKRAEMNRKLGVKRLKLQPNVKPKTIKICNHYMKGRCHKGDECSFSHDAIPLTKSKPCSHFARNSCMKGDNCPFDHELSKYPCNNFVSKGYCVRGDTCMFSHKMPVKDGSPATSDGKPEPESSFLPGISPFKNTKKDAARTVPPPAQAPKGISFLSLGRSQLDDSCKLKQGGSYLEGSIINVSNQMSQSASNMVRSLNEVPKRTLPAVAPKGINFLSLGEESSNKKEKATLPADNDSGIKMSPLGNASKPKRAGSSLIRDFSVGSQNEQHVLEATQNRHEMQNGAPVAKAPHGTNALLFVKASSDDSSSKQQSSLPDNSDSLSKIYVQEKHSASDKLQNSSAMSSMLPDSPVPSSQSCTRLPDGHKIITSSAQKALLTTLAFAAKYDSKMNSIYSTGATTVRAEVHKESNNSAGCSGSSQKGSMKASKILDFIFGFGVDNKTKQ